MRNDGEDSPSIHLPSLNIGLGLRLRQVAEEDLSNESIITEQELHDRILRSAGLRSDSIVDGKKNLERNENGKDLIAKALAKERPSCFDCNICWDSSSNPVLTPCGHLFCWSCLYRWLHFDSDSNHCPVCDGEVTETNIIPIYGRGSGDVEKKEWEVESGLTVPPRPRAQRVEGLRQSAYRRSSPSSSRGLEEAIRRISNRASMMRQWIRTARQMHGLGSEDSEETTNHGVLQDEGSGDGGGPSNAVGRVSNRANSNSLHEWIRSARQLRREESDELNQLGGLRGILQDESNDRPGGSVGRRREPIGGRVLYLHNLLRRQGSVQVAEVGADISSSAAAVSMVETSVGTLHDHLLMTGDDYLSLHVGEDRRVSENGFVEDRDSVSSTAAVIQNGSVSEFDSVGSLFNLEGRGRRRRNNETFRSLDMDDGIPPASRRRSAN